MSSKVPFYIIDDDMNIVDTLSKLVMKVFPNSLIYKAYDGLEGWEMLNKQTRPSIIICDYNMPGINGMQIAKKIRTHQHLKEAFFILITSSTDKELPVKALQSGVDEILLKPFSIDQFIIKMKIAAKIINGQTTISELGAEVESLKKALDSDVDTIIQLLAKIQDVRFSEIGLDLSRVVESSEFIADKLADSEKEVYTISVAAKICHVGKLFLTDRYLGNPVVINGLPHSKIMEEVPQFSEKLLGDVRGLEDIRAILRHLYENYDGSGFPSKEQAWKIPLGSRIIRVALDFDLLIAKMKKAEKVIEQLEYDNNRLYDFRVVAFFDQFLAHKNSTPKPGISPLERPIAPKELEQGQVLSRNIITTSGHKLLPFGTKLDDEKIDKTRTLAAADNLLGTIYIRNI